MELRLKSRIPGVVYGVGENGRSDRLLVTCDRKELNRELRKYNKTVENRIFELHLDDGSEPEPVTFRQIQVRDTTDYVISANFLRFARGRILKFPLRFIGTDDNVVLKRNGYIHRVLDFIACACETPDVPDAVYIAVGDAEADHVFRLSDIIIPPGLTMAMKRPADSTIAVIKTVD